MSLDVTIQPDELPEALVAAAPHAQGVVFDGPFRTGSAVEYRTPWRSGTKRVFIGARREKEAATILKHHLICYIRAHWGTVERKAAVSE